MRWNIRDFRTGDTITVDNPTDYNGRQRLMQTIIQHTAVGQTRAFQRRKA